ncbi:MAG: DUF2294 domain-containing protein [Nitrospirota bacterium]|nr:DUF2294 domain-containing protein [Nitrospirota bacterium]
MQQQEALEAAVRKAVCQFELEFMAGSFAERIRVLVASDMIIVRSQGVLPAAEQQLARTEEGQALVKQLYHALFAQHRRILVNQVAALTGMAVTDVLTDFALSTGEQVIVFLFASHHED